jgi:hypothetical protein
MMIDNKNLPVRALFVAFGCLCSLALGSLPGPASAARAPRDSDRDGLSDTAEATYGTNRNRADTDGDGLSDGFEVLTARTNPLRTDTDGDGLSDGLEVNTIGSNPLLVDTDGDGLSDGAERNTHGTNPLQRDSDLDGLEDGEELSEGTDPLDPDSDGDGVEDGDDLFPTDPDEQYDADLDGIGDNADSDDNDNGIDDDLEDLSPLALLDMGTFPLTIDVIVCPWDEVGPISLSNPNCEAHSFYVNDDGSLNYMGYPGEWREAPVSGAPWTFDFAFPGFTSASMQYVGSRVLPEPGALACYEGQAQALGGWYNAGTGESGTYWFDTGRWSGCLYQ